MVTVVALSRNNAGSARYLVAATSLSDIVCGFHVAARCIETTSDPTTPHVWRELEVSSKLPALRRQKPQSSSCRCVWRSALLVLIMLCGIRGPNDGDCTYWPRIASFLRSKLSMARAFGFRGSVAATNRGALAVNVQDHLRNKNLLPFSG
jgi:hypothetical protein